jgi:transcriptional regulator with XRE-family HTH domain
MMRAANNLHGFIAVSAMPAAEWMLDRMQKTSQTRYALLDVFAKNLRGKMVERGIDVDAELARQLNVNPSTLSRWCTGQSFPKPDDLVRLAMVLQTSIDDLLSLKPADYRIERHAVEGFEWESRLPDERYIPALEREEISLGVELFNHLMSGDDHTARNLDSQVATRALIAALRSGHVQLLKVPRWSQADEMRLCGALNLQQAIVSAIPATWQEPGTNIPGHRILKTEFVAFLASREVLHDPHTAIDVVGLGVGLTILRMCELSIPGSKRFNRTTWTALAAEADSDNNGFTNHSANGIAALMFNRHPRSLVRYAAYAPPPRSTEPYWQNITTAFITVTALTKAHIRNVWDNFAVYAEPTPTLLYEIYLHLIGKHLGDEVAGHILGHIIDRDGKEISIDRPDLADRLHAMSLRDLREKVQMGHTINLLCAGRHKIEATMAAVRGGYCNSLIVDSTIAAALMP